MHWARIIPMPTRWGSASYGLEAAMPGVATNVAHIDSYNADYFGNTVVPTATAINDAVANQSWIFNGITVSEQQTVDTQFDQYAVTATTLFVSAVGNGGAVSAPATCYDGLGEVPSAAAPAWGQPPTTARAKPDLRRAGAGDQFRRALRLRCGGHSPASRKLAR